MLTGQSRQPLGQKQHVSFGAANDGRERVSINEDSHQEIISYQAPHKLSKLLYQRGDAVKEKLNFSNLKKRSCKKASDFDRLAVMETQAIIRDISSTSYPN
jgi:hypothetical protein